MLRTINSGFVSLLRMRAIRSLRSAIVRVSMLCALETLSVNRPTATQLPLARVVTTPTIYTASAQIHQELSDFVLVTTHLFSSGAGFEALGDLREASTAIEVVRNRRLQCLGDGDIRKDILRARRPARIGLEQNDL
jgi:hypothetical protein